MRIRSLCSLILLVSLTACSPFRIQSSTGTFASDRAVPTIIIEEPQIGYGHDPAEEYVRLEMLVAALGGYSDVSVVAPWEADVGEPWPTGRDLTTETVIAAGISQESALLLEMLIEHSATERVIVPNSSRADAARYLYKADAVLHLIVRDGRGREELTRVSIAFEDDPLVTRVQQADNHPRLTEAIALGAAQLRQELRDVYAGGMPETAPQLDAYFGAQRLFDYGAGGAAVGPSFATYEELDEQVMRLTWHQRLDARIDVGVANSLDATPIGLWVVDAGPPAGSAGIQAGDLIVSIDGKPAYGQQVWVRAFLRTDRNSAVQVGLLRGGASLSISVPRD
jgi:hypothetical protein